MDNKINSIEVNNTLYDIEDGRVDGLASWVLLPTKPTYNYNEIIGAPTSFPSSDVSLWAKAPNKPSYIYREIGYSVETLNNASNAVTIDGSKPVHVIFVNGPVTSVALSTEPEEGHSTHVFFYSLTANTIAIAHNEESRICPEALNLSLSIKPNGYVEVDFLKANGKIFVRGI